MCKFKKILILFIFYFFGFNNVSAENKIAYIDIDFILSNTNIGKQVFLKLK